MNSYNEKGIIDLNLLLSVDGIGPGKIRNLLVKFKTTENIISSDYSDLIKIPGINKNLAVRIINARKLKGQIREKTLTELNKLHKMNASVLTMWDDDYPPLLQKIYDPPLILFYKGRLNKSDEFPLAIVGTRKPTGYGRIQTEKLTSELAKHKITIISGLARGIDSITHSAALRNSTRTIAVIGSGLDIVYPPENKKLFEQISENGAVISEYNLGTKPDAQNFPRRNRIISGLSLGCIVVETGITGGAMQTAAFALEQNREVFAVPGNVGIKQSEGTNLLIQRGEAKLITSAEDILVELNVKLQPAETGERSRKSTDINLFEEKILSAIESEALYIDRIASLTELSTSDCLVHLLTLEFKGLVKQLPGKIFSTI